MRKTTRSLVKTVLAGLILAAGLITAPFSEAVDRIIIEPRDPLSQFQKEASKSLVETKGQQTGGDFEIQEAALNSKIVIRTERRFAGAISSLIFRGKEFINADDNGRELQSSVFFDEFGACFNPTEAGNDSDGAVGTSSKFIEGKVGDNWLETRVNMAYWLPPGRDFEKKQCGKHPGVLKGPYTEVLSGDILHKKVKIGYKGLANVIVYTVTFLIRQHHDTALFEALTGYMPKSFSKHLFYDIENDRLFPADDVQGSQAHPVILSTKDENYAMGVYSPDLPQNGKGYGRNKFPDTNKWNCTFRERNIRAGDPFTFRCFVIIGNVTEVKHTIKTLSALSKDIE